MRKIKTRFKEDKNDRPRILMEKYYYANKVLLGWQSDARKMSAHDLNEWQRKWKKIENVCKTSWAQKGNQCLLWDWLEQESLHTQSRAHFKSEEEESS